MVTIPTQEPTEVVAGDTWRWMRTDLQADYPAGDGWALSYVLINAGGKIEIGSTADGDAFLAEKSAADSASAAAGTYAWEAFVTNGADRFRVGTGTIKVLPNFAAAALNAYDTRSHARKVLDAIEAVLEKRASKDQQGYTIDGRRLDRTPLPDLLKLRDRYLREARLEEQAKDVANGRGGRRTVAVRFGGRG